MALKVGNTREFLINVINSWFKSKKKGNELEMVMKKGATMRKL